MQVILLIDMKEIALIFKALSHPARLTIAKTIRKRKHASFTDLLEALNLNPLTQCGLLDYHLKQLCKAGILEKTSEGYRLTRQGEAVLDALNEVENTEVSLGENFDEHEVETCFLKGSYLDIFRDYLIRLFQTKYIDLQEKKPEIYKKIVNFVAEQINKLEHSTIYLYKIFLNKDNKTKTIKYIRHSLIALHKKETILGVITGLATNQETPLILTTSKKQAHFNFIKGVVTGIWLNEKYNIRKTLNLLLKSFKKSTKAHWIQIIGHEKYLDILKTLNAHPLEINTYIYLTDSAEKIITEHEVSPCFEVIIPKIAVSKVYSIKEKKKEWIVIYQEFPERILYVL